LFFVIFGFWVIALLRYWMQAKTLGQGTLRLVPDSEDLSSSVLLLCQLPETGRIIALACRAFKVAIDPRERESVV
jgi:hypothetical protein